MTSRSNRHTQHQHLSFYISLYNKRNQGSLEKLILDLGLGKFYRSQDCLIGAESKEVLKKRRNEDISKGHRSQPKELPVAEAGTTKEIMC